ncbi:S4 domain-containing protein [Methylomonas sp. AM2-LC]|uniref:RNA-binding S4 domain-containing protein n=1 Tax=Methylomonas sp. AM2-LC TaxID=3153301 RepID=UPI003264B640
MNESLEVRIDKWLWAARFFKTRQLAAEAVSGGKVNINGQRCKPGKEIKIGDLVKVGKDQYIWEIRVLAVTKQRRTSKEAVLLYNEEQDSVRKRMQLIELHKQQQALLPPGEREHKPNKKQRRQIHRFKQDTL